MGRHLRKGVLYTRVLRTLGKNSLNGLPIFDLITHCFHPPPTSFAQSSDPIKHFTVLSEKVDALTQIVECRGSACPLAQQLRGVANDAIVTYSKEKLGLRNFAWRSEGALIINDLTSTSLYTQSSLETWKINLRSWITGIDLNTLKGLSPTTVLLDDMNMGGCWAMRGRAGRLPGVALTSFVNISHITINHMPAQLASDITTAPREIVLWGRIERSANVAGINRIRGNNAHNISALPEHPDYGLFLQLA
ncbi:hypothetical protein BJ138DRAFT_1120565 [Hygrophoropsis aurantiaca]|uniref:Uncharacterized protein n=1 Tax=Hygrophoropsis aurantiaca TaxID=72124 RepID=A0ACB7ZQ10_9AGAM|nr:hypothetical protein BJ138DRAFT_1120565 [Hygrophoropsis aurantiaca]